MSLLTACVYVCALVCVFCVGQEAAVPLLLLFFFPSEYKALTSPFPHLTTLISLVILSH